MNNTETLPLISIIVPVYNVKDYITKCLDSICGQTYKNLEIIIVDDGSTDGSGDICDLYAQADGRIKVFHQSNAGQSAARNRALDVAQGEYIGFVDSDDWIEKDMYEFLYCLAKENDADISICSHYRNKRGKSIAKYSLGELFVLTRDEAIRALVVDKRIRNYLVDKLYKRRLFDNVRLPLNRIYEDLAVSYKIFYGAEKIVLKEVPKYHYVIREGSSTQSIYNPEKEYQLFLAVSEQSDFVRSKGIWDKTPNFVIQRGLHLIDHILLIPVSEPIENIKKKVLQEMHRYDELDWKRLGLLCVIKRWAIYHHITSYSIFYRLFRSIFKSKRHRFQ